MCATVENCLLEIALYPRMQVGERKCWKYPDFSSHPANNCWLDSTCYDHRSLCHTMASHQRSSGPKAVGGEWWHLVIRPSSQQEIMFNTHTHTHSCLWVELLQVKGKGIRPCCEILNGQTKQHGTKSTYEAYRVVYRYADLILAARQWLCEISACLTTCSFTYFFKV